MTISGNLGNSDVTKQDMSDIIQDALLINKIPEYDDAGTYLYIGHADPGTATSAASWRIERKEAATGKGRFADGNTNYDNIWDNRASLSYS